MALDGDFPVAAHGGVTAVETGHERSAGGGADAGAAVSLEVARALAGHAIEPRGLDELLAVGADVTLREVVAEDENDVGLRRGGGVEGREDGEDDYENE